MNFVRKPAGAGRSQGHLACGRRPPVFSNASGSIHRCEPGGGEQTWEEEGDLQEDVPLTQTFAFNADKPR